MVLNTIISDDLKIKQFKTEKQVLDIKQRKLILSKIK